MILKMEPGNSKYDIIIEHGGIFKASEYFNLNRKTLIVTERGRVIPVRSIVLTTGTFLGGRIFIGECVVCI